MSQITVEDLKDEEKRGMIPLGQLLGLGVNYACPYSQRLRRATIHAAGISKVWLETPPRVQGDKPWVEAFGWELIKAVTGKRA